MSSKLGQSKQICDSFLNDGSHIILEQENFDSFVINSLCIF